MKKHKIGKALTTDEVQQAFKRTASQRVKGGKSWEILKASPKHNSEFNRIIVDGREMRFGSNGALRIRDEAMARDIKQQLGGRPGEADVCVVEVDDVPAPGREPSKSFIINAPWREE